MAVTPLKRIRVEDDLWEAFGEAATAFSTDRTKLLVGFMRRLVASLEVGQDEAADLARSRRQAKEGRVHLLSDVVNSG